ncbi:MAG: alanine racemase [Ileibacterium sp.]|nr:alanine racemase [Ileibacterium sp.]
MLDTDALRAWAEVDYSAIAHNVKEVQKLMGSTKIMGIVKADAYGHGDIACAKALRDAGVDFFAVACMDEAVALRQAGIEEPILILGYTPPARFQDLIDYDLIQSVLSLDFARKLSQWAEKQGVKARGHVKLDTGMNRTGILYQENDRNFDELLEVYSLPGLRVEGIFSHFPVSDELEEESVAFTTRQMELFNEAVEKLKAAGVNPGLRHIQNSYGILNYGDQGYDYCRPGLLYMGVTSDDSVPINSAPDFIPILSLKTKVTMVKTIQPGATVSYGRHYTAKTPRRIASLSIGYADGLPRACSNQSLEVLIRGQRAAVTGNICMDQCMVDVTDIEGVQEGDIVTIVGKDGSETVTVDTISRLAGTINNESLTRLTKRVPRLDVSL